MRSFKFYIFTIILSLLGTHTYGQITIDGKITDSELNPISDALVEIIDETDTNNIYSDVTDASGNFSIANITDIEGRPKLVPTDHIVLRNYPNPFNPTTMIYFELPKADNIEIKIYDILGREVRTLYNNFKKAGVYHMTWDGRNNFGGGVAAGIYFCRLKTKDQFKVHKMVLLDGGSTNTTITSSKIGKEKTKTVSLANSVFYYSIKVTGNNILESEFNYLSCSSDTTLNLMVPKILKSVSIGPEGGKLETEDFSLTIPEGAFTEIAEIKLGIDAYVEAQYKNRLTKIFRLDGFPNSYTKALKLVIKKENEVHDSIALLNVSDSYDPITSSIVLQHKYFEAVDSADFIVCEISPTSNYHNPILKNGDPDPAWPFFRMQRLLGISGPVYKSSDHFTVRIEDKQSIYIPLIDGILECAEKAYSDYCNILGISEQDFTQDINTKMENKKIDIWNAYKDDKIQFYDNSLIARPSSYCRLSVHNLLGKISITIRIKKCADVSSNLYFLNDIYHYFYYLYPILYNQKNYKITNQYWLHHSIAAWSEDLYAPNTFIAPLDFNLHYKVPFDGIQRFIETSPAILESHGIGMSALIKHLTNVYGNNIVGKFFNGLKSNPNALEVILDTLNYRYNTKESIWWPNFFKEYLQGNIYNVQSEKFLNYISKTIEFADGDTLKYVDETYNDLSAKLYKININSEDIKNNKSLNFKVGPESLNLDYVKALVFGISDNNLVFISEGIDFSVGNLYKYDNLLVCVVNSGNEAPYTGSSSINLDVHVKNELQFNACKIETRVMGVWEEHLIPPPQNTDPNIYTMGYIGTWYTVGNFTDNVFEGVIDTNESGRGATGTIHIEVDDQLNISSFNVQAISHYELESSKWECSGLNIPLKNKTDWNMYFDISGEIASNSFSKLYSYHEYPPSNTGVIRYTKLTDYSCDENSYIKITLFRK